MAGLSLGTSTLDSLAGYFDLLQRWNRRVSLTALPVESVGDEAIDRLLVEPVLAARHLPSDKSRLVDIGSGGGSPAVPIKIVVPGTSLRMVESRTRKAAFLREVVRILALEDVAVEAVRYQDLLSRSPLQDSADVITVRAVRVDVKFLAEIESLLKPQGLVFLFTGSADAVRYPPQFAHLGTHPLLPSLRSRLEILQRVT